MNKAYEAYCPACPWCARWHCARESCATREITWWLRMRWVMCVRDYVNYGCWKFLPTLEDFVTVLPTHFTHVVDAMMWRHRMNWERPSMCSVMLAETITSESTHSFFFFHYGTKTRAERLERENLFQIYWISLHTCHLHYIHPYIPCWYGTAKAKKAKGLQRQKIVTRGPSCKSSVPLVWPPRKSALDYLFYGFVQREIYINVIQFFYLNFHAKINICSFFELAKRMIFKSDFYTMCLEEKK